MIKHRQKIIINANIEKVWYFINNLSRSLIFDRNYTLIELPASYAVNKNFNFFIHTRYFFKTNKANAKITHSNPPLMMEFEIKNQNKFNFNHKKRFILKAINNQTEFDYYLEGTFNNFIYNLLYIYIIKISASLELNYIKKAVESSENHHSISRLQTLAK